jgi:hypothetical protein
LNGQCAQRWEALELVRDNPSVRYCALCNSAVHLVEREVDRLDLERMGKCVAIAHTEPIVPSGQRSSTG